jgi:hypothetical protein
MTYEKKTDAVEIPEPDLARYNVIGLLGRIAGIAVRGDACGKYLCLYLNGNLPEWFCELWEIFLTAVPADKKAGDPGRVLRCAACLASTERSEA